MRWLDAYLYMAPEVTGLGNEIDSVQGKYLEAVVVGHVEAAWPPVCGGCLHT